MRSEANDLVAAQARHAEGAKANGGHRGKAKPTSGPTQYKLNEVQDEGSRGSSGAQQNDRAYARKVGLVVQILFEGKWKAQILCELRSGPVRLGHLTRMIPRASKKMLAQNLRKLEADGIVVRRDLTEIVLHVEYTLHEEARSIVCDVLDQLARCGDVILGHRW